MEFESKLEELCAVMRSEFNTSEPPVLFLDEKTYLGVGKEMMKRALNPNGSNPNPLLSITLVTHQGFNVKIFNKNELYRLTNVINRICEVD